MTTRIDSVASEPPPAGAPAAIATSSTRVTRIVSAVWRPAVSDRDAVGDPLAAQAALGRPSKTSSIATSGGIAARSRPMSAAGGWRSGAGRQLVEQVRAVDEQPGRAGHRVVAGREAGHRPSVVAPVAFAAMPIGRAGLLLLVDLDGVLYRGADPVPGVGGVLAARAARATTSCTSRTTRCGTAPSTSSGSRGWARRSRPIGSSRRRARPRSTSRDHEPAVQHVLTVGASGMDRELRDAGFRGHRPATSAS